MMTMDAPMKAKTSPTIPMYTYTFSLTQSLSAFGTVPPPSSTLEDREVPFPISQTPNKVMTTPTQRTIGR